MNTKEIIISIVVVIVGLIFLGVGVWLLSERLPLFISGESTSGIVVDVELGRGRRGSTTYKPTVEFETVAGEIIIYASSDSAAGYVEVGDLVDVHYNPDNPHEDVFVGTLWNSLFAPGFFIIIAVFIIGIRLRRFFALR